MSVNVLASVQSVLAEILAVPADTVTLDSERSEFPGWDSMQHLTIVMEVESRLGCKIPFDSVLEINSVRSLCQAAEKAVAESK